MQAKHDADRTSWLNSQGYKVLRFWNIDTRNAQNEIWLTIHTAAAASKGEARMRRWRENELKRVSHANAHLPLDGGGGRAAAGGGASSDAQSETLRASPPQSALRADSSPIEGERGA